MICLSLITLALATAPGRAAPVVLPFELRGELILLNAEVNGQNARLILDTGSGISVLDTAFARQAGVELSNQQVRAQGSRSVTTRVGTARMVKLGTVAMENLRIAVVDLGAVQERLGYDVRGTIGYELFTRYVAAVDYDAQTLTLTEPSEFSYNGSGTVLPVTTQQRVPVVNAAIVTRNSGTLDARLVLDLGSTNWSVRLGTRIVERHNLDSDTVAVTGVFGAGVGGATEGKLLRMPQLRLGNLVIQRPSTALSRERDGAFGATSTIADGTIGVPVLRRTHLIVDYARSRVILEPRARFDVPDTVDASGLWLALGEAGRGLPEPVLRVSYVMRGSVADLAGVRPGDELLRIDDVSGPGLTIGRARTLLRDAGTTRRLTLRRNGQTRTVSLALRSIF